MSGISRDDVLHVARLSALEVPEAELDHLVTQMKSIVAMVEQLNEVTVDGEGPAVQRRPGPGRAASRRGGAAAAGAPAGGDGARICGRLLRRAAPYRHGGGMKAAAVARDVAARLTETDSIGLNATLDWSADLLDREAARVDAMPAPMPLARDADCAQGQHRHHRAAEHLRLEDPRGVREPVQRDGGGTPARGRGHDGVQGEHG